MKLRRKRHEERGVMLLVAMFMVVVVSSLSAALFTVSISEMKHTKITQNKSQWRFVCEGAVDVATKRVLDAIANYHWKPEIPVDDQADSPSFRSMAAVTRVWEENGVVQREVINVPFLAEMASYWVGDESLGHREYITRVDSDNQGVQTLIQPIKVIIPDPDIDWQYRDIFGRIEQVIEIGLTPIFQYAVFYDQDLELLPGPSMTLSGRVHSNNDIYVGVGNGSNLTINSEYFRSVGGIYRQRKNDGSLTAGNVRIKKKDSTDFFPMLSKYQMDAFGIPSESGFDSSFLGVDGNGDGDLNDGSDFPDFTVGALSLWNGSVQTGAHDISEVVPPDIGTIKRFRDDENGGWSYDDDTDDWVYVGVGNGTHSKGRYYKDAAVSIIDGVARDQSGNLIPVPPGAIQEVTMYDGRENAYITVTEIDIELLAGLWPSNGLLYAGRSDASSGEPNGIRLKNAEELQDKLTLVSEDPVYVLGDYNKVNKKPASIMTDAINLLSNAWDDSKGSGSLPSATETTYNAAFITGAYVTEGGVYNGGFENLPRFHENWSGVAANIRGSFVNVFDSEVGTGLWSYGGDNYTAPIRNWDYDTSFNNVGSLPPFTPNVVEVTRVVSNLGYNPLIGP